MNTNLLHSKTMSGAHAKISTARTTKYGPIVSIQESGKFLEITLEWTAELHGSHWRMGSEMPETFPVDTTDAHTQEHGEGETVLITSGKYTVTFYTNRSLWVPHAKITNFPGHLLN